MPKNHLPEPTVERLVVLYRTVCDLVSENVATASSAQLGAIAMTSAYNVRKDLSHLTPSCGTGSGYELKKLQSLLKASLSLIGVTRACVVGLGHIGSAILCNDEYMEGGYHIAAGFDSNINKLELMKTDIPLYPAHEIPERVRSLGIELAVIAVPADAAQFTADRLVEGGIRGIVNFTQEVLSQIPEDVRVRNISVLNEFRILSALKTERSGTCSP